MLGSPLFHDVQVYVAFWHDSKLLRRPRGGVKLFGGRSRATMVALVPISWSVEELSSVLTEMTYVSNELYSIYIKDPL